MGEHDQPVFLHVGGTTTGAEDLVVYLAANRAGLRRAGYGLHCFDVIGGEVDGLSDLMPGPAADEAAIADAAARLARRLAPDRKAGEEGFVLSMPDLAGPMQELLIGRFHSAARVRARTLARALGQPVERLVMVVQPYEVLFHAAWMRLALDRRIDAFADYAELLAAFRGGWAELGSILVEELRVRELVVQTAPVAPARFVADLVPGLKLRQPVEPQAKPRVTPSAVAMIQRCLAQGTRLQPGQRDRLIAFHARQPQIAPDYGFSALALSDLRGRYVADLASLQQDHRAIVHGAMQTALAAE
ncbi:hypothetical protein [Frigidibacter sp. SD6-1]|uniref:hypothetical protein n=1 Tax=Frigidibacter sp. SD6-1 TaxID=3032581 RepID=UPI0024E040F6|nr:hypothetical protein [Frigidibacter sp. SD6-1]